MEVNFYFQPDCLARFFIGKIIIIYYTLITILNQFVIHSLYVRTCNEQRDSRVTLNDVLILAFEENAHFNRTFISADTIILLVFLISALILICFGTTT